MSISSKGNQDSQGSQGSQRSAENDKNMGRFDHFVSELEKNKLKCVCNDFMNGMCNRTSCKFIHDFNLCKRYWRTYSCKYGSSCRKNHYVSPKLYDIYINFKDSYEKETVIKKQVIDLCKEIGKMENFNINNLKRIESMISNPQMFTNDTNTNNINKSTFNREKKVKNTETFEPMTKPVDMRIIYDLGCYQDKLCKTLTTRDVLLVPNLFRDFEENEIYYRLVDELQNCGIPEDKLIIPWHGNNTIKGTHMIASDWEKWKRNAPTFNMVISRIRDFFNMNVKATRLNWYQDTEQWKAFHFDAAKINPEKAKIQNFTVAVSFGRTRDCAFERDDSCKNVISIPIGDGEIYCFTRETNEIWRHGVLQELPKVEEGRISIVAWGWIDDVVDINQNFKDINQKFKDINKK
jgi:hypothetical protein